MVSVLRVVGVSVIGLGPLAYYYRSSTTKTRNSSFNQKLKTVRVSPDSHSTIALGSLAALIALVKTPLGGLPPPPDTTTSAKEGNPDECAATGQQGKKAKRRKRTPFYKKGPIV